MISSNIIDFVSNGCSKYETLMSHGLIRSFDNNTQKINERPVEDYIISLARQEENDRVLFNQRKKKITGKITGEKKEERSIKKT